VAEMRPIAGFADYFITDTGEVWSTRLWRGSRGPRRVVLTDCDGYPMVHLFRGDGRPKSEAVHRLVANAFLPPKPSPQHQVRHLDGTRTNNHVSNLAWGTVAENAEDKRRHGRTGITRGERNGNAKLTEALVHAIRAASAAGERPAAIARRLGLGFYPVWNVVAGRTWRHVGRPA
jgi:hypothetical protein